MPSLNPKIRRGLAAVLTLIALLPVLMAINDWLVSQFRQGPPVSVRQGSGHAVPRAILVNDPQDSAPLPRAVIVEENSDVRRIPRAIQVDDKPDKDPLPRAVIIDDEPVKSTRPRAIIVDDKPD